MVANASFNPMATTVASGSFSTQTEGYIQGTALDNPAARYQLAGGVLKSTETLPMWGGVGIFENIPGASGQPNRTLGGQVGRADSLTGSKALVGFSVFDQNFAAINWPQSPVPQSLSGMQVNFYRFGSNARVAVAANENIAALVGSSVASSVSWDFVNQQLVPYSAPTFSAGSYNTGTGVVTITTAAAHGLLPGDVIIVSGASGSGSYTAINGTYVLGTGTTGSTLKYTIDTGLTITISGATLSTGGVLPVRLLDVNSGGSMTVDHDDNTGFVTWNRSGTAAIIELY